MAGKDHKDWDWRKDYEREFGPLEQPVAGDEPLACGTRGEDPPTRAPDEAGQGLGDYAVRIPEALAARLEPFAAKRSITLERLVLDLLEVELDGELIDTTLGEDFAAWPTTSDADASGDLSAEALAEADAAHGSHATSARGSTVDAPASIGRPNGGPE